MDAKIGHCLVVSKVFLGGCYAALDGLGCWALLCVYRIFLVARVLLGDFFKMLLCGC